MNYLQNHCWCLESCWDRMHYDCRHMVSISSYEDDDEDWPLIIDDHAEKYVDQRRLEVIKELGYDVSKRDLMEEDVPNLKPHVLQWLHENVKDRKYENQCEKGWCVGSTAYRSRNPYELTVFFHRKNDAMNFIKTFSKYKKPVIYHQYFADVRKILNLETLKYEDYV